MINEWILYICGFIDITRNRDISRTARKNAVVDDVWKVPKYISQGYVLPYMVNFILISQILEFQNM